MPVKGRRRLGAGASQTSGIGLAETSAGQARRHVTACVV